jgi:hypothetical protein
MKTKANQATRFNWLWAVALLAIAAMGWLGWSYYQSRYPSWDEEVRLSDGRVITIHQKREYYENYGTNQSWVTIDLPELGGKRVWHSYLMPMRVDVSQGQIYVFGRPRGPRQVSHYRYPKHHLVAFVYRSGEFQRIPFLSVPELLRSEEGIYSCLPNRGVTKLTLDAKNREWCAPSGDKEQFVKKINLLEYEKLAIQYARLDGGIPISE